MEHESKLALETGADRFLKLLGHAVILAAIIGFLISPADTWLKILGIGVSLIAGMWVRYSNQRQHHGQLLVSPDGSAKWRDHSGRWHHGAIGTRAWSISHYAVLQGTSCAQSQRFLISRSMQQNGNYRILMSWLRLRVWKEESELPN